MNDNLNNYDEYDTRIAFFFQVQVKEKNESNDFGRLNVVFSSPVRAMPSFSVSIWSAAAASIPPVRGSPVSRGV